MLYNLLCFSVLTGLAVCQQNGDPTNSCPPVPLDIHLVVDTSKSIKEDQFLKLRNALSSVVDSFDIGPGDRQTRVAMVGFGKVAERYFDFDDHFDKASVKNVIENMDRVQDYKGTETGLGINLMKETFEGNFGSRPDAKHISLVITDGKSTGPNALQRSLQSLQGTDITQYAVGIGSGIDKGELQDIAQNNPDHVIEATDFDALVSLASEIASDVSCICVPVCKLGTCIHKTATCECPPGWTGKTCNTPACDPVCIHGTCNPTTIKCECDKGFQGEDCSKPIPSCKPICIHGTCNKKTQKCECDSGYEGDDCNTPVPTCKPACVHGTCDKKKLKCKCDKGYKGKDCSTPKPTCKPKCVHGKCNKKTRKCKCKTGYQGEDCSQSIPTCKPVCIHGTCNKETLKCECDEGYQGKDCGKKCIIPEEMDLILALDISNSLNKREYSVVKNFATRIVNSLNIGNTKTRVGVVKFGFKGSLEFGFTRYYTASSINNAINIMKRQPMKPQFDGTKTAQALNVAVDEFNNNGRQSGKIEWKLIEITDGMATDRVNLPGAIQRLADIGIETYAIGIGDFVKMSSKQGPLARQQLLQVARDPSRVFISPSFDEAVLSDVLQKLQEELGKCTCDPKCVHGTCNPKTLTCECDKGYEGEDCNTRKKGCGIPEEMDLMLALDISNSLNQREYSIVKNFATRIVNRLTIGNTKTRVGVVKFGFKAHLQFGFTTYYTVSSINNAISIMKRQPMKPQYDGTKTAHALNLAVDEFINNGRPKRDVAWKLIEITDGMATDRQYLSGAVQRLADADIETYAIGIGDFVKIGHKYEPMASAQLLQVARDESRVFKSITFDEAVLNNVLEQLEEKLVKC